MAKRLARLSCCLLLGLLMVCLPAGCGADKAESKARLTLTPVELSQDTKTLSQALGYYGKVQAFEYRLEGVEADGEQSLALDIWRYEDGRWLKQSGTMLEVMPEDKIMLVSGDDAVWFIAENKNVRSRTDIWRMTLADDLAWSQSNLMQPTTLKPGEEVLLRMQLAIVDESDCVSSPAFSYESFREDLAIEGCVVLTATFNTAE